ncbi:MAG: hypothetical protein MR484_04745 [Ruminococcus sp.]|nr:hypothetical protein [Ruminococcus sp.]
MGKMSLYGYEKKIPALAAGRIRVQLKKRLRMPNSYRIMPFYVAIPELLFVQGWYPDEYTSGSKKVFSLYRDREDLGKGVYDEIKLNKMIITFCHYLLENFKSIEECNAYAEEEAKRADELARIEAAKKAAKEAKREAEKEKYNRWLSECCHRARILHGCHEYDSQIDFVVKKFFPDQVGKLHWYAIPAELLELNGENKEYARRRLKERLHRENKCSKKIFAALTGIRLPDANKGTFEIIDKLEFDGEKFFVK